tara:strand:+ start:544 stop:1467 length:924 start_codon:yes stop_codon:yes gene_type:complete
MSETTKPRSPPLEEDFLDVDRPIPGQNYCCISFVSPEKMIQRREEFHFYKFKEHMLSELTNVFKSQIENILDNSLDNTIDISQLVQLKKKMTQGLNHYAGNLSKFKDDYEGYLIKEKDALSSEFDGQNNYQTSMRSVKVRGVYDTYREAEVRAKVLQRVDNSFDVFVGQVGYWLPWDPETTQMNAEYLNDDLNKLMKEYKDNEVKKDMFYQEQTRERKKEAKEMNDRLKEKLEKEKAQAKELSEDFETDLNTPKVEEVNEEDDSEVTEIEIGNNTTETLNESNNTAEDTLNKLTDSDPWMKRHLENN